MAIPELVRVAAERQVEAPCERRVPARARDQVELEYALRGSAIIRTARSRKLNRMLLGCHDRSISFPHDRA